MKRKIAGLLLLVMVLTSVIPVFAVEAAPMYTAVDSDFEWVADDTGYVATNKGQGYYKYIGTSTVVNIPEKIEDTLMTNYYKMFAGNSTVTKVLSASDKVHTMSYMFSGGKMDTLDITGLNVKSVTHANGMLENLEAATINVDGLNFESMQNATGMFKGVHAEHIDLSLMDISGSAGVSDMFKDSKLKTGYAKTLTHAIKYNSTSGKPTNLEFVVMPEITVSQNGSSTAAMNYTVQININSVDPIAESVYTWTTTDTFPQSGAWITFVSGSYVQSPSGAKDDHYLHIRVTDTKGRVNQYTTSKYRLGGSTPGAPVLQVSPTTLTKDKVTVTITSGVAGSQVEYCINNGPWLSGNTVTLTENGKVTARTLSDLGLYSAESTITVSNIASAKPTITFEKDGDVVYGNQHGTRVTTRVAAPDEKVDQYYLWTESETAASKTGSWARFTNNEVLSAPDKTGDHYLNIKVDTVAGHEEIVTSKVFKVDVTAPKDPKIVIKENSDKLTATVTITEGTDEHSGVAYTEYRIDKKTWKRVDSEKEFEIDNTVATIIEARTVDKAGNTSKVISEANKVDQAYLDKIYKEELTEFLKKLPYTVLQNTKLTEINGIDIEGLNTKKTGIQEIKVTIYGKTSKHKIEVVGLVENKLAASKIPSGHWSANAVKNAVSKGYIVGDTYGDLMLDTSLKVADSFTALNRLFMAKDVGGTYLGREVVETSYLRDTAWYYYGVNSVLNRFTDADFKKFVVGDPDRDILREEVALIVHNALKGRLVETKEMIQYEDLKDSAYQDSLTWMTKVGIMQGHNGKIMPKKTLTRAELMTILDRLDVLIR